MVIYGGFMLGKFFAFIPTHFGLNLHFSLKNIFSGKSFFNINRSGCHGHIMEKDIFA
jgi:hypothetical protein